MSYSPPPKEPLRKKPWIKYSLLGFTVLLILFLIFFRKWQLNGINLGGFSFGPSQDKGVQTSISTAPTTTANNSTNDSPCANNNGNCFVGNASSVSQSIINPTAQADIIQSTPYNLNVAATSGYEQTYTLLVTNYSSQVKIPDAVLKISGQTIYSPTSYNPADNWSVMGFQNGVPETVTGMRISFPTSQQITDSEVTGFEIGQ